MKMQCQTKALGQYPTRVWFAEALVEHHFPDLGADDCVIEPSCGKGAFLGAIPPHVPAIGVEIDAVMAQQARMNTGRPVLVGDFLTVELDVKPTVILGNPPFKLELVDGFLDRAFSLLPEGGKCAFILPTFAFQTASRVAKYAERWSLMQSMIPRNVFRGLSKPLVFAIFSKDRCRTMVGFTLYREVAEMQCLAKPYRDTLTAVAGPVWLMVVEEAMRRLGGVADVQRLYAEIEGKRPTKTQFWKEQIRRTLRRYAKKFVPLGEGRYRLHPQLELTS